MHYLTQQALQQDPTVKFRCECCGRKLNPRTMTWLEMHWRRQWAEPGKAEWSNTEDSQGCFPVGATCAKRLLQG